MVGDSLGLGRGCGFVGLLLPIRKLAPGGETAGRQSVMEGYHADLKQVYDCGSCACMY